MKKAFLRLIFKENFGRITVTYSVTDLLTRGYLQNLSHGGEKIRSDSARETGSEDTSLSAVAWEPILQP